MPPMSLEPATMRSYTNTPPLSYSAPDSVVECLNQDRGVAAGANLTGALRCVLSKTRYPLLTGST